MKLYDIPNICWYRADLTRILFAHLVFMRNLMDNEGFAEGGTSDMRKKECCSFSVGLLDVVIIV
jgi:hypothetical protein